MEAEVDNRLEELDKVVAAYVFDEVIDELAVIGLFHQGQNSRFILILNNVLDLAVFLILITIVLFATLASILTFLRELKYALIVLLEYGLQLDV